MFLFVFAGIKRRSGKFSKFQYLIPTSWGIATFSSQKVLVSVVFSSLIFAVLSIICNLKQSWWAQFLPWKELNHQKEWKYYRALWENY